jgi:hypothetical protein
LRSMGFTRYGVKVLRCVRVIRYVSVVMCLRVKIFVKVVLYST